MVREEIQHLYAGVVHMYGALNSPLPPPKPALPSFYLLSPFAFIHPVNDHLPCCSGQAP